MSTLSGTTTLVEVCISDPHYVDQSLYNLWLQGLSVSEAAQIRKSEIIDSSNAQVAASTQRQLFRLAECIQNECEDEFRAFEMVEKYIIDASLLPHDALIVQFSQDLLRQMHERYYDFDGRAIRNLLGKKLTGKDRKSLEECEEKFGLRVSSCQRQFDNLKRVRDAVLEYDQDIVSGKLSVSTVIQSRFAFSPELTTKYSRIVFLSRYRFDTFKKLSMCSFADLEYFASVLMSAWADPNSPDGDDIDAKLIDSLRSSKTFLGDCDDLRVNFAQKIASDAPLDISQYSAPSLFSFAVTSATSAFTGKRPEAEPEASEHSDDDDQSSDSSDGSSADLQSPALVGTEPEAALIRHDRLIRLMGKFNALIKELVSLASGLHKHKAIRNLFSLLMEDVVQPYFVKFGLSNGEVKLFFRQLNDSWLSLPQQRNVDRRPETLALWSRFMSAIAPIAVVMHARYPAQKDSIRDLF